MPAELHDMQTKIDRLKAKASNALDKAKTEMHKNVEELETHKPTRSGISPSMWTGFQGPKSGWKAC
jgi:hypothetical protein